jgi:hypothetical protein
MRSLVVVIALLLARAAYAGECGPEGIKSMSDFVEARAKLKAPPDSDADFHLCLWWDMPAVPTDQPQLAKRLRAACETILTKRPQDALCTNIAALLHLDQLGKTDIVAALDGRQHLMSDPHTIDFLGATNSLRASPVIVRLWKQLQPVADAKPNDTNIQNDWAAWRVSAAAALGSTGDADARAFLAEQVTHKIDRGVKRTAVTAIQAIDKRLAK